MAFRRIVLSSVVWLAGSRLLIALIGLVGVATFVDQHTLAIGGPLALDLEAVWRKWDVLWYERIAVHGYAWQVDDVKGQAVAGFFPLYPLTVRVVMRVLPTLSFFWAGVLLSNALTLTALTLAVRFLTTGVTEARRLLLVMTTAAGSFYLSIPYTESLFLVLIVSVMILTRRRYYLLAAVLCGLAAVTRVHGLALIAVPGVACLIDQSIPPRRRFGRLAAMAAVSAIPFAFYMADLREVQGSAEAFIARQALWDNQLPYPLKAIVGFFTAPRRLSGWLHGAFWFSYLALLIRYWRQMPLGEAIFCAGALLISTQQETFHGIYRYIAPLVPLALGLSRDRDEVRGAVVAMNLVFGTIMILAFVINNRLAV
ncbi:MAG: hypothetical protein ABI652_03250 [Acidobacteriota bacterium]